MYPSQYINKNRRKLIAFLTQAGEVVKRSKIGRNNQFKPISRLLNFTKANEDKEVPPPVKKEDAKFKDTVNIAASERYINPSAIEKLMLGNNYRDEWSTLVNMRVFHLNEEKGWEYSGKTAPEKNVEKEKVLAALPDGIPSPVKPVQLKENEKVFNLSFNESEHPELKGFADVMWQYSGTEGGTSDPAQNLWVFTYNWQKADLGKFLPGSKP